MGQNYLKSLLALGFQAFLIMVVVGIYAVLIQDIGTADDISGAIWGCMGYTVLLCYGLFKTGSLSKACLLYTSCLHHSQHHFHGGHRVNIFEPLQSLQGNRDGNLQLDTSGK